MFIPSGPWNHGNHVMEGVCGLCSFQSLHKYKQGDEGVSCVNDMRGAKKVHLCIMSPFPVKHHLYYVGVVETA